MKPNSTAGQLRHAITLQSPTFTVNADNGEKTAAWQDEAVVRASIEPLTGREVLIGKSFSATTSHKLVIRYFRDIAPTWRIKFEWRIFGIDGITTPNEIKAMQNIYATETIKRGT